jgi:hypothetical protein
LTYGSITRQPVRPIVGLWKGCCGRFGQVRCGAICRTNLGRVGADFSGARAASSDGPALRRTRRGRRPDGGARRSLSPAENWTIVLNAKAWLVALACRKTKDLGYPCELWTTRFLAGHAREHGPAEGPRMPRRSGAGHGVQDPWPGRGEAAQSAILPGNSPRRGSQGRLIPAHLQAAPGTP